MSAATGGGQLSAATEIPTPGLHLGTPVDHIGIGKAIRDTITMRAEACCGSSTLRNNCST